MYSTSDKRLITLKIIINTAGNHFAFILFCLKSDITNNKVRGQTGERKIIYLAGKDRGKTNVISTSEVINLLRR